LSKDVSLSSPNIKREQLRGLETATLLQSFGGQGLITEVVDVIGDGKEATVYLCAAHPSTDEEWCVAKVYRAQKFRAFSKAASYNDGTQRLDKRMARAMKKRTRVGQKAIHHEWVAREWDTLCSVADAGADVPEPYAISPDALLMEYVQRGDQPAPLLYSVDLGTGEARELFDTLLRNVELFLRCNRIHGDLSGYNVLYTDDGICIIDLPQAVEARTHPDSRKLLERDVRNLCRGFERFGVRSDPARIAGRIWSRFLHGRL
jgi:RIO kinase 1